MEWAFEAIKLIVKGASFWRKLPSVRHLQIFVGGSPMQDRLAPNAFFTSTPLPGGPHAQAIVKAGGSDYATKSEKTGTEKVYKLEISK